MVSNPKYTKVWNDTIQPLFSASHQSLALYETQLLTGKISSADMQTYVNDMMFKLTNAMMGIGWVKQN